MLGTPEGARKRSIDSSLVNNMLAEDARKHEFETMPPRDPHVPEMSVMDTAFISPEEHRMLAHQSYVNATNRQLEAENQGLIRDYPEDYVTSGAGLFQLGKNLLKKTIPVVAKYRAPGNVKRIVENRLPTKWQMEQNFIELNKNLDRAQRNSAKLLKREKARFGLYPVPGKKKVFFPENFAQTVKNFPAIKSRNLMKQYGPKVGRDAPGILSPKLSYDHIRRFGGPSANAIIPAAVLHESMTE